MRTTAHAGPSGRTISSPCWILALALVTGAGCSSVDTGRRDMSAELELGALWQSRNDVAVPGDTGTRFELDELTGAGPFPVGRVELTWQAAERHELRGVIAPLSLSGEGTFDAPVDFAGTTFSAGTATDVSYRFDSYRLTYRYLAWIGEASEWRVGVTANVRDAEIVVEQGDVRATKSNVGVVPLLNVAGTWRIATDWRLALDVDAAAAPQGRAVDAALKAYWRIDERLELGLGYRTIEGGADNDEVYTFAWVHEAVVSLRYAF